MKQEELNIGDIVVFKPCSVNPTEPGIYKIINKTNEYYTVQYCKNPATIFDWFPDNNKIIKKANKEQIFRYIKDKLKG